MDKILEDSRFSRINKDARFRGVPKREKKVKIDKRFQSMFHDKRFKEKTNVDKRGRPVILQGAENLKKYYDLSEESDESEAEVSGKDETTKPIEEDIVESTKSKRKLLNPVIKKKLRDLTVDYSRGEGIIESDSSSEEESSEEEDLDNFEHEWGELDKNAATTDEATNRLALCNMDWDRITAQDLMVLFNSFLPSGGLLLSVVIYPSEFGSKRMAEEDKKGPTELTAVSTTDDQEDENFLSVEQREKLRQYQLNRLKYYYAVLEFDSVATANQIYTECDGLEYESSMNRLDLRFIPDDTAFDQEPKEKCTEIPDLSAYKPRLYRTTALTQVKVDLTWDETDPSRQDAIRSVHSGKFDNDRLNQFVAVSSSEDEGEGDIVQSAKDESESKIVSEKGSIDKYKALLLEIEKAEDKKKQDVSVEVTWDLKAEQKATDKAKEAANITKELTPFEQFLAKKKEKRKKKKEDKKSEEVKSDEDGSVAAFSDDDLPSDIDLNDPYFREEMDKGKNKTKKKGKGTKEDLVSPEDQQKQKELELLMMEEGGEENKAHFSLKKIEETEKKSKKKAKLKKRKQLPPTEDDNFKVDVEDNRFNAIFSSHLYNVDPADPLFRATEGMKALITEKIRRRTSPDREPETKVPKLEEKRKQDAELSLLVKSVKRKTGQTMKKN